ncbi:unnamed protein product, partial [Brenthis ino]
MSRIEGSSTNGAVSIAVPPLYCGSGSSSPDCSSSEESAVPYASENSDPRPDDGYEADIEIGKVDATTYLKTEKLSESLSMLNNGSYMQTQDVISSECPEYGKGAELAHPELCVIVVDVLSQLIDKLLAQSPMDRQQSEEVSRVCGALARARGARGLLRRLLAPAAPAARLLARDDPAYTELQRSVLELAVSAAARGVEAGEVAALLRLFAAPHAPVALLLPALRRLVPPRAHTPDCALVFPITPDPVTEDYPLDEPVGSSYAQQAEQAARRLRLAHLRAGNI